MKSEKQAQPGTLHGGWKSKTALKVNNTLLFAVQQIEKKKAFISNRSLKCADWNRSDMQIQWVGNSGNHSNSGQLQPVELFILVTGIH